MVPVKIIYLQKNFAPVEEIGELVKIDYCQGEIPEDFPEGVYIRNGVYFLTSFMCYVLSTIFSYAKLCILNLKLFQS